MMEKFKIHKNKYEHKIRIAFLDNNLLKLT
jgi:hypothetical protein